MTKLISLFNHKGGVSKTTTTFNLGWSLAELGHKTLIVDADPQCNLTAYCLGLNNQQEVDTFYNTKDNDDVYNAIKSAFSADGTSNFHPVKPTDTQHENLKLAAGNIEMSDMDIYCAMGMTSDNKYQAGNMRYVGLFTTMLRKTAINNEFEFVLIDMSPSSGAFNRSILMGSDYFIVPTYPEFFCFRAIEYLAKQLPMWADEFKKFRIPTTPNCLPKTYPKMLGIISQNYRPHKNEKQDKVKEAQKWIDKIQGASKDILAKSLLASQYEMVVTEEQFNKGAKDKKPYNLIDIPNFNSLILVSQKHSKPVFELTAEEIDQVGTVLERQQNNQEIFKSRFAELAEEVISLTK